MKESTKNNRLKKEEARKNREAKKAKNTKVEKRRNPNNLLIFLLILVIVGGVFGGFFTVKWFQKDVSLEKYLAKKENAGLTEMTMDEYTTMSLSAKKNDMNLDIVVNTTDADKDTVKNLEEYFNKEDTQDYLKYMAAYYLTNLKSNTRAISPSIKYNIKFNDKEIKSEKLTYRQAKKFIKKYETQTQTTTEQPVEQSQEVEIDGDNVIEVTPDGESGDNN